MTEEKRGIVITLEEMYANVQELVRTTVTIDNKLNRVLALPSEVDLLEQRVRKIEAQNAAHWVVHGIMVATIGAALVRILP